MKKSTRTILQTALLLLLCIGVQFLKSTSVYLSETVVSIVLILSVLTGGFFSAAVIAVIVPLTSWWITGSPVISSHPLIVFCLMGGNLIQVGLVWLFAVWLRKKMPKTEALHFSDSRFRLVLIVALVASVLWGAVSLSFLSSFASVLQVPSIGPALILTLVMICGVFLVFVCLWALVARFPDVWSLIAGTVLGAVAKAVFLWLIIDKAILTPAEVSEVNLEFSVTPLLTALLGSLVAFLIWLPLKKRLEK